MKLQHKFAGVVLVLGLCLVFSSQLTLLGQTILQSIQPIAGIYNSSPPTITNGAHTELQTDVNGNIKINIAAGGSTTVTEAATVTANQASVALTNSVLFGYDGSTDSRLRSRGAIINSADIGLVTRPFLPSDGTNTLPAMDAVARPGFQKVTDGTNVMADPCTFLAWNHVAVSQATATVTVYISAASSKKNYICAMGLVAGAAEIINLVEGTGANCGTGTAALVGSTTAANGMSFAANGGFVNPIKMSGIGTNVNTCIATSGANRVAGYLEYVQQ